MNGWSWTSNREIKNRSCSTRDQELDYLITITQETFQFNFYINCCSTVYKSQGETFNNEYTIHEWNRYDNTMKYTAISRATSKSLINIIDNDSNEELTRDTDNTRLTRRIAETNRLKNELYRKRKEALNVLSRIIHNVNTSDEFSILHTQLPRKELLKHLDILNGIPKG